MGALDGRQCALPEEFVRHLDRNGAITDRRGDPVDGSVPNVADGKDAGQAGFPRKRRAAQWPIRRGRPVLEKVLPGQDVAELIA